MTYQAIARKYRPQTFAEVIGQEPIIHTLKNAIQNNKVAHAYIFSGTRGVGKTTSARLLAKALNCEKGPTIEPCGACPPCQEIAAATSIDVLEIDAASNRGIDDIRELRENVRYLPARDRNKIFIIDEAHMLTNEAFNALLKTLEEPPERVVFLLATTEPHRIPATIHSRCQTFHFRTVSFHEILARLKEIAQAEGVTMEAEAMAVITRGAEGSLRDALSLLDQVLAYAGKKVSTETVRELLGAASQEQLNKLVEAIHQQTSPAMLTLVDELVRQGQNLHHFCRESIGHIRNLLIVRIGGAAAPLVEVAGEERKRLEAAAQNFSVEDLLRYFNVLLRTEAELRHAPQPRLHLELGLLKLVQAGRLASLEELLANPTTDASKQTTPSPATPKRSASKLTPSASAPTASSAAPASAAPTPAPAPAPTQPSVAASHQQTTPPPGASEKQEEELEEEPKKAPSLTPETLTPEITEAIKSAVYDNSKFLGALLDNVNRWDRQQQNLYLWFAPENQALIAMISKQQQEDLEKIVAQVLSESVYIRLSIESSASVSIKTPAKPMAEPATGIAAETTKETTSKTPNPTSPPGKTHPTVQALLNRFGGRLRPARDLPPSRDKQSPPSDAKRVHGS